MIEAAVAGFHASGIDGEDAMPEAKGAVGSIGDGDGAFVWHGGQSFRNILGYLRETVQEPI